MDTLKPGFSSNESSSNGASSTNAPAAKNKLEPPEKNLSAPQVLSKGVEHAKKRLRAFSIQKKTPIVPVVVPKVTGTGSTTVLIGKLSNVKPSTPKVDDEPKLPKPPKPGANKKSLQDSYSDLQKRTLAEIEDMKRKMELVELGIPLGLICPTSTSEKAMPTKAMPPIKHFLDPAKVDEIIREAKKARDEGKKYKFDYQKLLPKYDNPFQRKKDDDRNRMSDSRNRSDYDRDKRKSDRYDSRRYSDHRRDDRDKYKSKDKEKSKDRGKEKGQDKLQEKKASDKQKEGNETNVNLNDYLVCDSWSLDNEDKSNSSPKEDKTAKTQTSEVQPKAVSELVRTSVLKNKDLLKEYTVDSPVRTMKIEKLQPVIDSFKFEIDEDEILDIFDEDSGVEKYGRQTKSDSIYSPTDLKTEQTTKDTSIDANDDTFLESVIAEIKQEVDINEDMIQDKGLVEYDISPAKEDFDRVSITPELDDKMKESQSDYSGSYRSSESGYKSVDSYRLSMEKEIEPESAMSKSTVESLETWSFVLKICQPILFRHDKNKCYRETRTSPIICYTENPKLCNCVKDRSVVYNELSLCKMNLVDRVYGCDQISDAPPPKSRNWYPRANLFLSDNHTVPVSNEWEGDDLAQTDHTVPIKDLARTTNEDSRRRRSNTPQRSEEVLLDREYQRFMKAVWPEVAEAKTETSRSTTPVRQEGRKKKKEEVEKTAEIEVKKPIKRAKLSSEGWSQESDLEEEVEKSKKMKIDKDKLRKRKRSSSSVSSFSDSEEDLKRKKKSLKKKAIKKSKSKSAKKRRIGKKLLRKLKEKEKKKKKHSKTERSDDSDDDSSDRRSTRKHKKRKQQKLKKKILKRKKKESSSSSSSSDSSSESDEKSKRSKNTQAKRRKDKRRRRKKSTSESAQSEDLFDVNILNNIKTERLTDDEKSKSLMDFSPRKQKPREIINVKELQNDFVGNNIHIKKEIIEEVEKETAGEKQIEKEIQNDVDEEISGDAEEKIVAAIEDKNDVKKHTPVENLVELESPAPEVLPVPPPEVPQPIPIIDAMKIELPSIPMPPTPEESTNTHTNSVSPENTVLSENTYNYSDAGDNTLCGKAIESVVECEKFNEGYQQDYEMYEHLAMAYQSDVASQQTSPPVGEHRIETLVRSRNRGEIKCDWRAGISPSLMTHTDRPSRWGLKPGEVNIVLTAGGDFALPARAPSPQPVYKIQSIANRTDTAGTSGYDEAYLDMYGASDRLQYGDCFSVGEAPRRERPAPRPVSLDDRIDQALKNTVLGEVAKEEPVEEKIEGPEKGILITTSVTGEPGRASKRVSFADGYKPGQDSDVEEPPVKKKRKSRRVGCAWPCPATHADHVALWDALPPPPPPPGSPPPPCRSQAPPLHLLRALPRRTGVGIPPRMHKHDSNSPIPAFIPSEPPPNLFNLP